MRFNAQLGELRQSLEATSKSLSSLHAKRVRLAKELSACDEEIGKLETHKAETLEAKVATSNRRTKFFGIIAAVMGIFLAVSVAANFAVCVPWPRPLSVGLPRLAGGSSSRAHLLSLPPCSRSHWASTRR